MKINAVLVDFRRLHGEQKQTYRPRNTFLYAFATEWNNSEPVFDIGDI